MPKGFTIEFTMRQQCTTSDSSGFYYTYKRLDFPFCTTHIARLCNMGCAEIGKS